jgi:hypothetical protein
VAQPLDRQVEAGRATGITLAAQRYGEPGPVRYEIATGPTNRSLNVATGAASPPTVVYTPEPGFQGTDSFTYSARDANSSFPRSPATATVTIQVGSAGSPAIRITQAPESVVAGTSAQLQATVSGGAPAITWSVDGAPGGNAASGTITPEGLYTAPPQPPASGAVSIAAHSAAGAGDARTVRIVAAPEPQPAPLPAPVPVQGQATTPGAHRHPAPPDAKARLTAPTAMLAGRRLVLGVTPARAGVVRLTAYAGTRRLGSCTARTLSGRSFTCRLRLPRTVSSSSRIRVVASLRVGGRVIAVKTRRAARVPASHRH